MTGEVHLSRYAPRLRIALNLMQPIVKYFAHILREVSMILEMLW
jgi:hypothetical protein